MSNGPAPISEIIKRAKHRNSVILPYLLSTTVADTITRCKQYNRTGLQYYTDLLAKCYHRCDKDIFLSIKGSSHMGLITGWAYDKASTRLVMPVMPDTKAVISFQVPDPSSGKIDILYHRYRDPVTFIDASIGLNRDPYVDFSATVTYKGVHLGGSVGFDTASASFTKYIPLIGFKGASLLLMDKGKKLLAVYHVPLGSDKNKITAELTHRFPSSESIITLRSDHVIDSYNTVKTKFSSNGKVSISCQREWRPKSFITVSAKYNVMRTEVSPKWGLAMALNL